MEFVRFENEAGAEGSAGGGSGAVSLHDELATALDGFGEGGESSAPAKETVPAAGTESAAKTTQDQATGDSSTQGGASSSGDQVKTQQQQSQQQQLVAPEHWTATDKALFATAPAEVQKRWLDREKEFDRGLQEKLQGVGQLRQESEQLSRIFKPFERDMGLSGISRTQAMEQLVAAHRYLLDKPAEAIQWLAGNYGVDLKQLAAGGEGSGKPDPKYAALETNYLKLNEKLDGFLTEQQREQHSANLSKVNDFAGEKGADGKLLRPYFDEVAADIVKLMRAGEKDLAVAYKKAVRLNDDVWAKVQAEDALAKQKAGEKEQKEKVDKAKRATAGAESAAGGGTAKPKTLREDLESGFSAWPG